MDYITPQRDILFSLSEVLGYCAHSTQLQNAESVDDELLASILGEAAKFVEAELNPLYRSGDEQGCRLEGETVSTPEGFVEAYTRYIENGWPSLAAHSEFGGQGLPYSMHTLLSELLGSANWSWSMYAGLSQGALNTIFAHGRAAQKQRYLPHLVSGSWTGTMCLTEPHCGTDLGMLRTRAEPNDNGGYTLTGNKIFISSGDHDLTENIVHIVLARLPNAPAGTKGISLFIVPKMRIDEEGNITGRNTVNVGRLEEKMGIHGNATCALNFDGAEAELIGPPHQGLACMFTFMNLARIGTSIQGLSHCERAYQGALHYAKDRLQSRDLRGAARPDLPADPLTTHPDVRRMLLTQKAYAEGLRLMLYDLACTADLAHEGLDEAQQKLAILTPIAKALATELGIECASLGVQVLGGHGYIREWGMEQNLRDARIGSLYEGTTGIQALDLLGRKIVGSNGALLRPVLAHIDQRARRSDSPHAPVLLNALALWRDTSEALLLAAWSDPREIGAASVEYLLLAGHVLLGYYWLCADETATAATAQSDEPFYRAKRKTAHFYFQRLLPKIEGYAACLRGGAQALMAHDDDEL